MPGFYGAGEYDVAGFCVGIVEKSQLLNGSQVKVGDVALGLASSGVHSNGFSLVRKVVESQGLSWESRPSALGGKTLGEVLLTPTQIYVQPILAALRAGIAIHGMAHITGGGLPENLPRCLGRGQAIAIAANAWESLPIFQWIAEAGQVKWADMIETFNMGIGYVVIVPPSQATETLTWFQAQGLQAFAIGEVVTGQGNLLWR
jgi:phosphoribosylformylglycinamidine cyclo-ligase